MCSCVSNYLFSDATNWPKAVSFRLSGIPKVQTDLLGEEIKHSILHFST